MPCCKPPVRKNHIQLKKRGQMRRRKTVVGWSRLATVRKVQYAKNGLQIGNVASRIPIIWFWPWKAAKGCTVAGTRKERKRERERGGGSEKAGERASLDGGRRPGCLYRSRRMSFERSHQNLICECSFPQRHSCECHSIKWKTNYSQYKRLETDKAVAMPYFLLRSQFFFFERGYVRRYLLKKENFDLCFLSFSSMIILPKNKKVKVVVVVNIVPF